MQPGHGLFTWPAAMFVLHEHGVRQSAVLTGCGQPETTFCQCAQHLTQSLNSVSCTCRLDQGCGHTYIVPTLYLQGMVYGV